MYIYIYISHNYINRDHKIILKNRGKAVASQEL